VGKHHLADEKEPQPWGAVMNRDRGNSSSCARLILIESPGAGSEAGRPQVLRRRESHAELHNRSHAQRENNAPGEKFPEVEGSL